jgi:hypothetical protein
MTRNMSYPPPFRLHAFARPTGSRCAFAATQIDCSQAAANGQKEMEDSQVSARLAIIDLQRQARIWPSRAQSSYATAHARFMIATHQRQLVDILKQAQVLSPWTSERKWTVTRIGQNAPPKTTSQQPIHRGRRSDKRYQSLRNHDRHGRLER